MHIGSVQKEILSRLPNQADRPVKQARRASSRQSGESSSQGLTRHPGAVHLGPFPAAFALVCLENQCYVTDIKHDQQLSPYMNSGDYIVLLQERVSHIIMLGPSIATFCRLTASRWSPCGLQPANCTALAVQMLLQLCCSLCNPACALLAH